MAGDLRRDFPLLQRRINNAPIIYLDSAAMALVPEAVLNAQYEYYAGIGANVNRGKHALAVEGSLAFDRARHRVAEFINADPCCTIFLRNATEGLNLVANGLGLSRQDRVVAPVGEHHSNLAPWMRRANLIPWDWDPRQSIDPGALDAILGRLRPRVLAVSHVSNVTGVVNPVAQLCAIARRHGVLTVVDASQSAPHLPLDVQVLGADFLVFSGQKLMGPQGTGVLWGRRELLERLEPPCLGGGSLERVTPDGYSLAALPQALEAGTSNVAGVIGLAAAIDYLGRVGWARLAEHDARIESAIVRELQAIPELEIIHATGAERTAIVSFAVPWPLTSDQVAILLSNSHNIMVRSGQHCAHPLFAALGRSGAVRISAFIYNSEEEIHSLGRALRGIVARLLR